MSTRTKTPSRTGTESTIVLGPEEFGAHGLESGACSAGAERSEPGGRAQRGGVPGMTFEIGGVSPVLGP